MAFIIVAGGMVSLMVPGLGASCTYSDSPLFLTSPLPAAFLYGGLSRRKSAREFPLTI